MPARRARTQAAAIALVFGFVVCTLTFPGAVLADNCGDLADCWSDLLKASLAVAGGAVLAALLMRAAANADDDDAAPTQADDGPPSTNAPRTSFPQNNTYEPGGINTRS